MNRFYYFAGFAYIAVCGVVVARELISRSPDVHAVPAPAPVPPPRPAPAGTAAQRWFASIKPYCNSVEVEIRTQTSPPPAGGEGGGYLAACYGLAGKIGQAKRVFEALDAGVRATAANIVFEVAHPIADAGDDRSSGPMMQLVIAHWPSNYMAMYHAGMSEYALGQFPVAEKHLRSFLQMYTADDGYTVNAKRAVDAIERTQMWRSKPVEREPSRP
jgi:hypothetical protein